MANFKSIVIPEKIIIVENSSGQGYVVLPDKPDMLESAKSWADGWVYGEGANWTERHENGYKWEPIVHEFENGKFSLTLCDSADNSYNGGKLSFWNCMIKAPNGKEFKIGINQELLCNLLKDCTLIKGVCQENIWLGKQLSNTGVYIDTMQDFLQAKEELEIRKQSKSKTVKYQVGDIVGTLTRKYVYLGQVYRNYDVCDNYDYSSRDFNARVLIIRTLADPKQYHMYVEILENGEFYDWTNWDNVAENKRKYTLYGHMDIIPEDVLSQLTEKRAYFFGQFSFKEEPQLSKEAILKMTQDKSNNYKYRLADMDC